VAAHATSSPARPRRRPRWPRLLAEVDRPAVLCLLQRHPAAGVSVAARVEAGPLDRPTPGSAHAGGELWGVDGDDGMLSSVCLVGGTIVPVAADEHDVDAYALRALRVGRRTASLSGPADAVLGLWARLEHRWGPARDVRPDQPLLAMDRVPMVASDPQVRQVREADLEVYFPACVAMSTEEVGISPVAGGMEAFYRARVLELVRAGRAYARFEDGQVAFKAELGAVSSAACQVQGVWVRPDLRGRGLASPGMAAVVEHARAVHAALVTLYVNDYNTRARRVYDRVGFEQVGTFASILL
jgi:hypothetical protein